MATRSVNPGLGASAWLNDRWYFQYAVGKNFKGCAEAKGVVVVDDHEWGTWTRHKKAFVVGVVYVRNGLTVFLHNPVPIMKILEGRQLTKEEHSALWGPLNVNK